jgi:hypothetical protein
LTDEKEGNYDEAKTTRIENREQRHARAEGGRAQSEIGQIIEAEPPRWRRGKGAFADQGASRNPAI